MPLSVRPALPQDGQFIYDLIYQVMYDQLLASQWDPAMRHPILDMQVRNRLGSHVMVHPHADHAIILLDDRPVGRLMIDRSGEFYHLVDISVTAKYRGAGIGTRIVLGLCMEAEMMSKKVRLYVSVTNPRARELYHRLGFRVIEDSETDALMERAPGDQAQVIAAP